METLSFEAPKAGIEDFRNEDSFKIRQIANDLMLVLVSDGASTGVFSKEWSDHITNNFDSAWLSSAEDFEFGIKTIRETFKPDITRQTALRKFLMQGSYATLLSVLIKKNKSWFKSNVDLTMYAIGDVCIFIFSDNGELEFTFPYLSVEDFNNVPDLIRSSNNLQEKTPYKIFQNTYTTSLDSLIVVASDALSEYLFKTLTEGTIFDTIKEIAKCENNEQFKRLMNYYRDNCKMKNDDVTICFITDRPDLYYPNYKR
ncbi:MAG: protein phosphatase 2C family protein [Spirochaetota bacterium]|nr:protein phosphatase 2C family protein [Spirochaetota bacterium]